jgi:hypothetical protein
MSKILNEKETSVAIAMLTEKMNAFATQAKAAINEHQPLGVSDKVGAVAQVIGTGVAVGVEKAIVVKKGCSFFLKSVLKSYVQTREGFNEVNKMYEVMRNNIKTGSVDTAAVDTIKAAIDTATQAVAPTVQK